MCLELGWLLMGSLDKGHAELSIDWDRAFLLYESAIASHDNSLQVQATLKLAHMSNHAPEYILVLVVPILVDLLNRPCDTQRPSVQEASAYCLKCIACQGEGKLSTVIGQSGAIPSLLSLLQDSEVGLQKVVLKCLRNIVTFSGNSRMIVVRNGGLEIILSLLNTNASGLRCLLLEILSALALLKEVRRIIFNSGDVCFLVEAVRCGSMISRTRAAQAVGLLGLVKRARPTLVRFGVVEVLIELIREGNTSSKLVAANALGVISSHVDYIRPVAEAGAIPLFAEILEECGPMGKDIAEDVFCILAFSEENAIAIFHHLVRILGGSNEDAKMAAADVLWNLSSYKHLVTVTQNSGVIRVLLEILTDGRGEIKERVSGIVAQLSYDAAERLALADSGAIPLLIDLLQDESDELRDNAAEALVNFSEDPSLSDRISCVFDNPVFRNMQERLFQIRSSDVHLESSLREISIEQHLTWEPSLS